MKKKSIIKKKPFIIWFTGLSSSGKTTLSISLKKKLFNLGYKNLKLIDGDLFRKKILNFKYDLKNREKIGILKARLAKKYQKEGKIVIVSGIANKKKWRSDIKSNMSNFIEVYTKCPISVCKKRDKAKNYKKAQIGKISNFIGINEKYEEGNSVDLKINTGQLTVSGSLIKIINYLKKNNYVF
tara:strand:- start:1131 stop:1679 length:549 start_codon:yes stop_codon:yes gene_type:complete